MASTETAPGGAATPTTSGALAAFPLTIREWVLAGIGVLLLVVTFLPIGPGYMSGYFTVWSVSALYGLLLGVLPLATAGLVAARRFVPTVPWRVGSLTVDQFASVVGVITLFQYVTLLNTGGLGIILGLILTLAWVFFASFAHLVPPFSTEFAERPVGQPISLLGRAQILPLPAPVRPVVVAAAPPVPGAPQPFWALSPEDRPVVDAAGATLFTVGPAAWALVVEDRGTEYVIRHDNGTTGVLKDLTGVTRA